MNANYAKMKNIYISYNWKFNTFQIEAFFYWADENHLEWIEQFNENFKRSQDLTQITDLASSLKYDLNNSDIIQDIIYFEDIETLWISELFYNNDLIDIEHLQLSKNNWHLKNIYFKNLTKENLYYKWSDNNFYKIEPFENFILEYNSWYDACTIVWKTKNYNSKFTSKIVTNIRPVDIEKEEENAKIEKEERQNSEDTKLLDEAFETEIEKPIENEILIENKKFEKEDFEWDIFQIFWRNIKNKLKNYIVKLYDKLEYSWEEFKKEKEIQQIRKIQQSQRYIVQFVDERFTIFDNKKWTLIKNLKLKWNEKDINWTLKRYDWESVLWFLQVHNYR